jgi:uncharacterized cupin superfamily protein
MIAATAAAIAIRYNSSDQDSEGAPSFVGASPDMLEMKPLPIEPSWVIAGNPQARAASHSKASDECAATGIWDCTAGTFRWFFGWDETVVIIEGEVQVTAEDGTQRILRSGDVAYFKGGTWATWHIETYVKKIAFLRKPFPAAIALLYRLRNLMRAKAAPSLAG